MSLLPRLRVEWSDDASAVVTADDSFTYAELARRIARAEGWLAARGVGAGDVVAVQLPKAPAFLELHLGCLARGAVTLPLNPSYAPEELRYFLEDSAAALAVLPGAACSDPRRHVPAEEIRRRLDAAAPVPPTDVAPSAPAVLMYTSGTTGRPKGALLTHGNIAATVEALHSAWRWSRADTLVHALPLFHVHGLFVAQLGALRAGARSIWLDRFEANEVLELIERERATVFMGVPTFYHRLLQLDRPRPPDLSSMRLFTSGSAPLPAAHHRAFANRYGHEIVERYGMTEVGIVLSNPVDGPRRPGTVGLPLPGVAARVTDGTGRVLGPGEVGELRIAGPSVFFGYLGRPEQTAAALQDGWMHTGDVAYVDEAGYFVIAGRSSDMILSGSLNVYPAEVEASLVAHPGVREAAVLGVPDADLGERVVATVVADPHVDAAEIIAHARSRLAPYKVPRSVALAEELPRNAMGKVLKHALRDRWTAPGVRLARSEDADWLVAGNIAMALETEGLALDRSAVHAGVERVFEGGVDARYYVAVVAGSPAGQAMVTREWSDWRATWVWWIQSVYVIPAFRRIGVFRAIYEHLRAEAVASGAAGLRLYVDHTNRAAAEVYARLGMSGDHYAMFEDLFD